MARSPDGKRKVNKPHPIIAYTEKVETDPGHHITGPFRPQTPLDQQHSAPPSPAPFPPRKYGPPPVARWSTQSGGFFNDLFNFRWIVVPASSLKLLLLIIVLWANWEILSPYVPSDVPNPFRPLLFISHRVPSSPETDPRYQKGYLDLVFVAYYIVFWSFVRQSLTIYVCKPIARYFGLRKEGKQDRFGEQGYALIYFAVMGTWGARIMSQLPTWWYRTEYFWIDYPHWDMKPELKAYYLVQMAYWWQQLIVLLLGLEKPRKDYRELVAHHFVTLWLVGWSYLVNLTLIGNAVYLSMDLPDTFLAASKLLNYMQWERAKTWVFAMFMVVWSYFRHWLNWVILYSVWFHFDLIPETAKRWYPEDGVWMVWWMRYQIFIPIVLLQCLNLFWWGLMWRIAYRAVTQPTITDVRSDDEGDDDEPDEDDEKNKDD